MRNCLLIFIISAFGLNACAQVDQKASRDFIARVIPGRLASFIVEWFVGYLMDKRKIYIKI